MSNETMKAIHYHKYGGADQLALEQAPRPQAQPGTVLVRVKASGVNPWDWKMRSGAYQKFMPVQFPATPGIELAGIVEEIGPDVTGIKKGERVFGAASGTNAEYVVVPSTNLAQMPASLSFDQAASVPVGATTAWRAIDKAGIQAGQRVLVLGAAGGVGSYLVQLARLKGAHVIGTASAHNLEYVRSLGADTVIDYQAAPAETAVHDVDVVLDTVGGETGKRSLQALRRGGIFVTVAGQPPKDEADKLGVTADSVGPSDPVHNGELLRQTAKLIESGKIKVQVTNVFPLAEAGQAHALGETGHGRSRIVLHVAN